MDRVSGTVLDGMHRLAAITKLRIENIVCFLVDYGSGGISLGRWARVYRTTQTDLVSEAVAELGEMRTVTLSQALELLESRKAGLAVLGKVSAAVVDCREDLDVFQFIKNLDEVAGMKGWDRSFAPGRAGDYGTSGCKQCRVAHAPTGQTGRTGRGEDEEALPLQNIDAHHRSEACGARFSD